MNLRLTLAAVTLTMISCGERVVLPSCPMDTPVQMDEWQGVRYRTQLQDALRCSRETGRPVLLVFTGYAVSGYGPHTTWHVFEREDVQRLINDRLVLCALMVDDREPLAPEDLVGFPQLKGNPTTIGQRNSMLEAEFFSKQSQPLYTLVNADMTSLAEPLGYVPKKNAADVVQWIEANLEKLR